MSTAFGWAQDKSTAQWRVLLAAMLGWGLDGMDVMLYAFALTAIRQEFSLSSAQAGALASVTLIASAFGGVLFGYIADRIGRTRALMLSIIAYSIFTALTATAHSVWELVLWRTLLGLGLGGEWVAGSVLVAETWPAQDRGKAVGVVQSGWAIGYIAAALLAGRLLPTLGWRALFIAGVLPALCTLWIRYYVPEPPTSPASTKRAGSPLQLFRPPHRGTVLIASALSSALMFAYWGLFTWVPAYLSSPLAKGGAGLAIVKSTSWIIPMQVGAFFGYILFGVIADRIGRRPAFALFVLGAAAIVPIYGAGARAPMLLLAIGPLVGFFGHGYFTVFGAMLAELFPASVRAMAQGLCYNIGRAISAAAPATIGFLADRHGIGFALATTSVLYVIGAAIIYLLPETRGRELA
ncbi:MAG TPA: MFS transporter [Candidatus Acidoferrales bacterium]|nr:MFS transporter [Candidatus Acidoferrales bacterium]